MNIRKISCVVGILISGALYNLELNIGVNDTLEINCKFVTVSHLWNICDGGV